MKGKMYVVKVEISYVKMEFTFHTMTGACNFMELFLDHINTDRDDYVSVRLERVNINTAEENEESEEK